jgi:hypothetical protein
LQEKDRNMPARASHTERRIHLYELMLLIAGLAFGMWVFGDTLRNAWKGTATDQGPFMNRLDSGVMLTVIAALGGLSLVGVPLLLWKRWRVPRRPWGAGSRFWFTQGMASWLLWPPVVYQRVRGAADMDRSVSATCYLYGTPLMAVYVTAMLLANGNLRRWRRRRLRLRWYECFGLLLGLVWACTGLYVLAMFYRDDFSR